MACKMNYSYGLMEYVGPPKLQARTRTRSIGYVRTKAYYSLIIYGVVVGVHIYHQKLEAVLYWYSPSSCTMK